MTSPPRRSPSLLDEVLADVAIESRLLDDLVAPLDESGWRTPTPAAGWDVATSIAHLAWTDEAALAAAADAVGDGDAWRRLVAQALQDPAGFVDRGALAGGAVAPADLLSRWRTGRRGLAAALVALSSGTRMPWFGPPMSPTSMATARFMETWAHGLDVHDALGVPVEPNDRVRHVAHLGVRTRDFSFRSRGLEPPTAEIHVLLTAPGGAAWEYGDAAAEQSVTGPAWDFALLVTQRRNRADLALIADGADADRWLDLAQAFAGPPGTGRQPRGAADA